MTRLKATTSVFVGWNYTDDGKLIRPCGTVVDNKPSTSNGYLRVSNGNKSYLQHRVVFFLHHGYWPKEVDHKDRDRANNSPGNLIDATRSANVHNTGTYTNNTSGVKGVAYDKHYNQWVASIMINGKRIKHRYTEKQDAINKRNELEKLI